MRIRNLEDLMQYLRADAMTKRSDEITMDNPNTGGSRLSCTAVKPDSRLARIFLPKSHRP